MLREDLDKCFQPRFIFVIKPFSNRAVDIQQADQAIEFDDRYNDLGIGCAVACDMAGKFMHVLHDDRFFFLSTGSANAFTDRNAHAGGLPLERSQHEFSMPVKIKSSPIHLRQGVK